MADKGLRESENGIILIKKGVKKLVALPNYGEVIIKVQDGIPVRVESVKNATRFEELPDYKLLNTVQPKNLEDILTK